MVELDQAAQIELDAIEALASTGQFLEVAALEQVEGMGVGMGEPRGSWVKPFQVWNCMALLAPLE